MGRFRKAHKEEDMTICDDMGVEVVGILSVAWVVRLKLDQNRVFV